MNCKFCFASLELNLIIFLEFFVIEFHNDFKVRATTLQIQNKLFDNLIIAKCTFKFTYTNLLLASQCNSFSNDKRFMIIYGLTIICSIEIVVKVILKNS